jgi:hypothetical protein
MMMVLATVTAVLLSFTLLAAVPTLEADQSKLKEATHQVESGVKAIGAGIENTARGVGNTVIEGVKVAGEKLKESGQTVEPQAKGAWEHAKKGASDFGQSVKAFVSGLFSK